MSGLQVMVPNSPGSGYDTTAREWVQVLEDEGLAESVEVFNLEGAGGTVGLQRLVNEDGNADMLMQMGLGVVGAQYSNQSEATLDQTTPIAKLIARIQWRKTSASTKATGIARRFPNCIATQRMGLRKPGRSLIA